MDPLKKIRDAKDANILPDKTANLIEKRFSLVVSGIERIEKASLINMNVEEITRGDSTIEVKSFEVSVIAKDITEEEVTE